MAEVHLHPSGGSTSVAVFLWKKHGMDEKKLGSRLLYIPASCDLTFVAWAELVRAIYREEAWPLGENPELFSVQAFYHDSDVGEFVEVSLADKVLSCVQGFCAKKIKFIVNEHLPAIPNVPPKDAWVVLRQGQLEQQKAESRAAEESTEQQRAAKSSKERVKCEGF